MCRGSARCKCTQNPNPEARTTFLGNSQIGTRDAFGEGSQKLAIPIGPIVVPFWVESYKVIPKRNYYGPMGRGLNDYNKGSFKGVDASLMRVW